MNREMKLIPTLRFPEFVNEDEWKLDSINSLFDLQDGYAFSSKVFTSNPDSAMQVIRITDINNQNKNSEKVFIPEDKIDDLGISAYSVENGDLLLSLTGAAGFNFHIWENGAAFINQRTMKITPRDSKNESLKVLLSPLIHEIINGIGTGQNNNLSKDALRAVELPIPQPQEQQKIASCLSSLDELLTAHNDKLEALKDHKKGLMQNLFPQEGETVPNYRFPEFEGDGEWNERILGEVYSFLVTNSFSRAKLNYEDGEVKNIHYGDIHTKFSTLFDISREDVPYIDPDVSIEKIREECYCQEGDIIFADASEDLNDVGKSIEIINLNGELLVSGLHTLMARQNEKTLEIGFGGYLFKSDWIRKQIQREAQGAKVLGISTGRISNIKISFPQNPKEQQKIASCLSAVDELITAQQEKIEQLQQHKKGLMQGLFPEIEN